MFKFWYDATMLAFESQRVIALRMLTLASGGARARTEASRMTTEKVAASVAAAATMMTGGSPGAVMSQVRRKVRANSRRLSR
jgi:hypothetical protein